MIINGCKTCCQCKILKPICEFRLNRQRSDGYKYSCKECDKIRGAKWARENRQTIYESQKAWRLRNKDRLAAMASARYYADRNRRSELSKKNREKLKTEVFDAYGNKCECCGENKREFLCIDHRNGGGTQERKGKGKGIHPTVKNAGFPKDKYQLLCHNCNMSLGFYGYCPHHPEITRPRKTGRPRTPDIT